MTDQQPGFQIGSRFYPMPTKFGISDPILVREVTGLTWDEFIDALDNQSADNTDPTVIVGMLAVAIWQENRDWTRAKVMRMVAQIDFEDVQAIGEATDDADPPRGEESSPTSQPDLNGTQGSSPGQWKEPTTGTQPSATGAQQ